MTKILTLTLGLISSSLVMGGAIAQVPIETNGDSSIDSTTIPNRNPSYPQDVILTRPSNPNRPGNISAEQRFSCQSQNGQYTVMYQPKSQTGQFYPWAVPAVMGGGWSSERRCNEISRRLEQYRPDGLTELRTGVENGYNVICATTDRNGGCRIVLTVPVGADPNNIRDRVFANLTTADSGQSTIGVNTYAQGNRSNSLGGLFGTPRSSLRNNSNGIDLKPFLDSTDGGTGRNLRTSDSRGLKFRPNRF
jgi:Circadian oscillating protein COP23